MFFNSDSLFVVGSIIFIGLGVFTLSKYNFFTTVNNNESLVNTSIPKVSNSDLSSLDLSLSKNLTTTTQLIDAGIQTDANIQVEASVQAANTYVNTGMQTSSRMWLESIRNWINEILSPTSNPNPQFKDVGVQTNTISTWQTVKQWFLDVCSVRSSQLSSLGNNRVEKWRNKLDASEQSVDLHDSESPLTILKFGSDSELQKLVDPNDSASQVSEVVSVASPKATGDGGKVYDVTDLEILNQLMEDPSTYSYYDITDNTHYLIGDTILSVDPSIWCLFI
jgi:hypothetical protein